MSLAQLPTIVVPMAGNGSRFTTAGYTDIKPLIPIFGKPMIAHVADSVGIVGNWVFIVQKAHRERYPIDEILTVLRPGCKIVETAGGVTEGAACSVLLAEPYVTPDAPLIIINSDNIISWDTTDFDTMEDGLILCFNDTDPRWSFVRVVENIVVEVAEKTPISNTATAGMYIWKRGSDFIRDAKAMIALNIRVNNEFYICPVYNQTIANGGRINVSMVNKFIGLGTPEELERYISDPINR